MSLPRQPHRIPETALAAAIGAAGIPAGSRLLVAVSGGPDSTALLHALVEQASSQGWELRVAHINHALRGDESAADEEFVRALTRDLGLAVTVESVPTKAFAREHRLSDETAARTLRYRALRAMLSAWPGDFIVTGHTLDDQAETVLMHLLRGSGLSGLTGMKPRTADVIRPFLSVTHAAVIQYLERRGLPYRRDSTNWDRRHARNRVRHDLLPVLAKYEPTVRERIASAASLLREDLRYLEAEASAASGILCAPARGLNLAGWHSLHPALRRSVLRSFLLGDNTPGAELPSRAVLELEQVLSDSIAAAQGAMPLAGGMHVRITEGYLTTRPEDVLSTPWEETAVLTPGETAVPVGTLIAAEPASGSHLPAWLGVLGPWHALFDGGSLHHGFTLRTRQPGDRMRPLGAPGSRKVQDVMVDARVPAPLRASWPLLTRGDEIVWIPGVARSQTALIGADTQRVIHYCFQPAPTLYRGRIPRHFP